MTPIQELKCPACGAPMNLVRNGAPELHDGQKLDLLLECQEDCGTSPLNAFVPITEFVPVA